MYVCLRMCGMERGCEWAQKRGRRRWEKNDKNKNDKDGSADIFDMNSTCISLANGIRFSYSAVIMFFNTAHNDTLWHTA